MAVRAGRLDRRITIQTFTESQNSVGEPIKTWSNLATVWAAKLDVTGREAFTGVERYAEVDTKFKIRWRDDLSVEMRISYDGRYYDIVHIAEIGRQEALEIMATAFRE